MSAKDKQDPLQPYLDGDSGVSSVYASSKQDVEPPVEVDQAILRAARKQTSVQKPGAKILIFPRRWMAPLAVAATLVLAVGVSQWFGGPAEVYELYVAKKIATPVEEHTQPKQLQHPAASESSAVPPASTSSRPQSTLATEKPARVETSAPNLDKTRNNEIRNHARSRALGDTVAKTKPDLDSTKGIDRKKSDTNVALRRMPTARMQTERPDDAEEKSVQETERDMGVTGATALRSVPEPISVPDRYADRAAPTATRSLMRSTDAVKKYQDAARLSARRLNVPYHGLSQQVWNERLRGTRAQWWGALQDALTTGQLERAYAELAAFAAVYGDSDPEVVQQAQRMQNRITPATR